MNASAQENKAPILSARGITKVYEAVVALQGVDIDLYPGTVTALVGDNGAGKSTLLKILAGSEVPDDGEIILEGKKVQLASPMVARNLGIEAVYQDLAIAPDLDATLNLFLGRESLVKGIGGVFKILDRNEMVKRANEVFKDLGIKLASLTIPTRYLSGGQKQAVAVARGVLWVQKVILMDEPTAALGVHETRMVLDLIKRVKEKGIAVLMVSHSMPDVFAVADEIIVLRHGRKVAKVDPNKTSVDEIVSLMTGAVESA